MPDVPNAIARDLAVALMRCQNFLPLFTSDSLRLRRAEAAYEASQGALDAYCAAVGTRPFNLWSEHGDKP